MIQSMTGFAKSNYSNSAGNFTLEIRSVNHRFLEIYTRLPDLIRHLEPDLKQILQTSFQRGKFDISLSFSPNQNALAKNLDRSYLETLKSFETSLKEYFTLREPSFIDFLKITNISPIMPENLTEIEKQTLSAFQETVKELLSVREQEGLQLKQFLNEKITNALEILALIQNDFPKIQLELKNRLENKIKDLAKQIDQQRIYQEIALIIQKGDIEEELSRLKIHLLEMSQVLKGGGSVGRKLDFLIQEIHREANTSASKMNNASLCHQIIDLKLLAEQMREQIQNIE